MADEPQRYIVMKYEAIDEIKIAAIKAMANADASAIKAFNKCMTIIDKYAVAPEDILGKEGNDG